MNNQGLYRTAYEHDACGVGMVVNIHGAKTHDLELRHATRPAMVPEYWCKYTTNLFFYKEFLYQRKDVMVRVLYSCPVSQSVSKRSSP